MNITNFRQVTFEVDFSPGECFPPFHVKKNDTVTWQHSGKVFAIRVNGGADIQATQDKPGDPFTVTYKFDNQSIGHQPNEAPGQYKQTPPPESGPPIIIVVKPGM